MTVKEEECMGKSIEDLGHLWVYVKVPKLKKGAKKGKKIAARKLADKPGDSKATKKQKVFARNARKWRKK